MAITHQERQKRFVLTSASGVALVGFLAILINLLGNSFFLRWDLTGQKSYSLSRSSRQLVRELTDPVIIKAYFTPDLPPPYNAFERYVRDMLEEYRSASRGRVRFEFVLTSPPADFEKKAGEAGLMPIQFEQVGSDQFQVRRGYMGLVLYHRDKTETVAIIKDVAELEYELTSRIAKMAVRTKKKIALVSGHGELGWQTSKLAQEIQDLYDFQSLPLGTTSAALQPADAVVVIGPKQKWDEKALWTLDQWIMKGTPVAFLLDSRNVIVNQFMTTALETGLNPLLQHYGVQVGDRLVYDAQCETIRLTQSMAGFAYTTSMRYPYVPLVDRLASAHPVTRGMDTVGLPYVTTVEPVKPLPAGVQFAPLFFSSPKSWLAPAEPTSSVSPNHIPTPRSDEPHGPYILGGLWHGHFPSYFHGKPSPVPGQAVVESSPETTLVVLGTSRFVDPALPAFPGSDALMTNLLAFLSKDETLIGIRSKGDVVRPLKPVSARVQTAIKAITVLGVATLPAMLGLWRWRKRQQWRVRIQSAFTPKAVS